jgi:spectinomycin phosphotransferase
VKDLPEEFDPGAIIGSLAAEWGFDAETIEYAPVGFGSYHWIASGSGGKRGFVTVDDLDKKPWLGDDRESAFDGLKRALGSAVALRDSGLDFVVAPILAASGEPVRRIGARYTVALFPFVDGRAGSKFAYETAEERTAVLAMLAQVHAVPSAIDPDARRVDLSLPGRGHIESALQEVDGTWVGGPFSEPARQALAAHAADVADLLALFDRLAREVAERTADWVITHGEPHPLNVMRTEDGYKLIDWDAAALAPPERDLWMLMEVGGDLTATYEETTGHRPDPVALDFFRLAWDLADLAAYIDVLRSPHRDSDDTAKAYQGLTKCVAIRDRWEAKL